MPSFDIAGKRKIWFIISLLMIVPSLISIGVKGFNFGIDFTGGTIIDLRFERQVTLSEIRTVLAEYSLDNSTIQLSGEAGDSSTVSSSNNVMIRTIDLEESERKAVMAALREKIAPYSVLREEKVGATIGSELIMNAVMALVISWGLIILYIAYRFELNFGIAAVLTLIHDVIIVLGVFSFTQRQIDASFIAALLTVVGYSINDTIVIFDRIRENLKMHFSRHGNVDNLVNTSIYQTLTRSIYTVLTVLFTTVSLYLFGGETTKDFSFALTIGIAAGSYSSIFIASPLWIVFKNRRAKAKRESDSLKLDKTKANPAN